MVKASDIEYVVLVDTNGNPYAVTSGSGGTSMTDDAPFTAGSSSVTPAGGVVTSDSVDSGDVGAFAMLANRQQKVTLYDSSGNEVSVGGGTQYAVDAALGATPTGTLAVAIRDDALSALTPVEGDAIGLRVDANGALWVIPSGTVTVDGSGVTQPVSNAGLTELAAAINASSQVDVNIAAQAVALPVTDNSGSLTVDAPVGTPVFVRLSDGSSAIATLPVSLASLPALAAGTNNIGDVDVLSLPATPAGTNAIGKLLPPDIDVTGHTNYAKKYYTSTGAATDGIVWSPAAGKRWHVVSMFIGVSAACTVTLEDDLAAGDSAVLKHEFAANGGLTINFGEKYPLASGEDAADLLVTTSAGNIYITCTGYEV